ncbi:MAG: DUF342 domain-containing protein [Lachnospiraceae bacterium]
MHSYFQIINEAGRTCLKLVLKSEPILVNEVTEYLERHQIPFNLSELNKTILSLKNEATIELCPMKTYPLREEIQVTFSEDRMQAIARFYPPSNDGELLSETDIIGDLRHKGVVFGVIKEELDSFLKNRQYCTNIVLARGKAVRQGKDAYIEYLFNTDLKAKPTLNPDGSVDFFHLNIINHVKKGDCLARLHPEDQGEDGMDVCGSVIRPKTVRKELLRFGRNIELSEDKTEIYSQVDGHVTVVEKKVFVSNVMVVENVDLSTGDIEYEGNLQVNGNVCSNFRITVQGDVEVRGVVEGAEIIAGGNVTIARGINGMNKGLVRAGGNIVAKYIENGTVEARGYVQADCILHSKVMAGTEVRVSGKKGFITGGYVCATNMVDVKTLGAELGANTTVEIGVSPEVKQRYQLLKDQLDKDNKTMDSARPILESAKHKLRNGIKLTPEQVKHVQELSNVVTRTKKNMDTLMKELEQMKELLTVGSDAQIIVREKVYPGTKLVIADVSKVIKTPVQYCRFVKQQGDVTMIGMN